MSALFLLILGCLASNLNGLIQGQADVPLNETGRLQGRMCAEALKTIQFDLAFSSDSSRAAETAEIVLAAQSKPVPLTKQVALRERVSTIEPELCGA